jgi:hypothetical protein
MHLYEQISFANRLGVYLRNFKNKKANLWEFSHTCEKETRGRYRSRAYIYQYRDTQNLNFRCHHCGASSSFANLLKDTSGSLYEEYRVSSYKDTVESPKEAVTESPKETDANLSGLVQVTKLPQSSAVRKFLERRKIPLDKYKLLYVAPHFYDWAQQYNSSFRGSLDRSPRLILPYFNENNQVTGFTARTFNPTIEPRYIHIRVQKNVEFIYGLERLDKSKTIYVTEGHIDSLFLDNAIAVGGAHYENNFVQSVKDKVIIIPDQDWKRNSQVAKQLKKVIDHGFKVALLPETIKGKDLNDFVKGGIKLDELKEIIDSHSASGLAAQLEFSLLKRCTI